MSRISQKVPLSTFYILVIFSVKHAILETLLVKTQPNPNITHCGEASRSMRSIKFGKKQVYISTSGEIWHLQIKIYPQTTIEPKYGALYLTNKVRAHGLGLLVQLS